MQQVVCNNHKTSVGLKQGRDAAEKVGLVAEDDY